MWHDDDREQDYHADRLEVMKAPSEEKIDAMHEAGHCIIGNIIGLSVKHATIAPPAHVTLSMKSIIKIAFDDRARAIFFLSGLSVQHYYYPDSEDISKKDREVLWGLPDYRRCVYTEFILHQLEDPIVRKDIETLAARLLTDNSITF